MKAARPPDPPPAPEQPSERPEGEAAALRLGQVMKRLHKHISSGAMQEMQGELTEFDLSFSQMTALHFLRANGASTVTSISECTYLSLPASSHLVERLVRRQLAQREENPDNRREKLVSLTDSARDILGRMDSGFVAAYVSTFSRLQPQTIQQATEAIQAILDELNLTDSPRCALPYPTKENP